MMYVPLTDEVLYALARGVSVLEGDSSWTAENRVIAEDVRQTLSTVGYDLPDAGLYGLTSGYNVDGEACWKDENGHWVGIRPGEVLYLNLDATIPLRFI